MIKYQIQDGHKIYQVVALELSRVPAMISARKESDGDVGFDVVA